MHWGKLEWLRQRLIRWQQRRLADETLLLAQIADHQLRGFVAPPNVDLAALTRNAEARIGHARRFLAKLGAP